MKTAKELLDAMQAIVDLADAETRSMSDEEVATYEGLEADLKSVNKTAELHSRQDAYRTPITGFPAVIKATPKGDEALEYAFGQYLRTGQANSDMSHLYAQNITTTTAGGFLVPDGFRNKLTERVVAWGGFRSEAETLTTSSGNPLEWPTVDDTASTTADVVVEGASSAAGADIVFGTKTLGAYRYAATGTGNVPIKVSVELLQDAAFDVGAYVAKVLGQRIARKQAKDLVQGTGSGMPLGILSGTDGDVSESTLTYAKLNELIHKLDPAYRVGAKWLFNDTVAAEIEGILDASTRPLLVPGTQGLDGSVARSSLLGYPVVIDQYCFDDGSNVQYMAFGNFKEAYIVREVKDVQILVNPYAATGYVVYDAWARMDGTIQNPYAYVTIEGE
jgi:HK97 family phage major capsid protein